MEKNIQVCPISNTHVDERVARFNGFISLLFVIAGIYFPLLWIFITVDFALRSFKIKFSPVARFNKLLVTILKLEPIPIDIAPKNFAARLGLLMSLFLIIFNYFNLQIFLNSLLVIFVLAISLEAFFNYCVGCKIYSLLVKTNFIKINK